MIPYRSFNAINIGFTTIYIWGIFVALAFLIAILLAAKNAKKMKLNKDIIYDLSFYILISSIIGARIGFFITHPLSFSLINFFKVWEGGMSFFGGFVLAFITLIIYVKKNKLDFWKIADIFALPIVIGHLIGRIGCYIAGEHIGRAANVPWSIYQEGALRHPVILYEILGLIIIAVIISKIKDKKQGTLFLTYLLLYSILRFIVTFFRIDDPIFLFLTGSQYVSIILFIISSGLLIKRR